ncbi:Hint domain-containing protein [Marinovum sp.]|uniref:Hint domain-containing protein n=1 Tax=Marinovum sp. TaxID=2024839 RepID=UPI002B26766E|nr:Hint domain-containing protein [Marinovum sp.]
MTHTELSGGTVPDTFEAGEAYDSQATGLDWQTEWVGSFTFNGEVFQVFEITHFNGNPNNTTTTHLFAHPLPPDHFGATQQSQIDNYPDNVPLASINTANSAHCFAPGTRITTPLGAIAVEDLRIGDTIATAAGRSVAVRWIGRQTLARVSSGRRMQPVRIAAGALGQGLPCADLTVTGDHGLVIDGLVINASALVNGHSIDWVPLRDLPDQITFYHVETEAHDVILANGTPAETFIDYLGRRAFDNFAEYLGLFGAERIIPEMAAPRISAARLLPKAIRARLGVLADGEMALTA